MKNLITFLSCTALFILTLNHTAKSQGQTVVSTQSAANAISNVSSIPTLTNSVTETTLFSKVVQGGLMGTSRSIYITFLCTLSSGLVNPNITINIKFGGQTLAVVSGLAVNVSLTSQPFFVTAEINNLNATNAQEAIVRLQQSTLSSPLGSASPIIMTMGAWAVDTTVDQTLSVTAKFNSALTGTTLVPIMMKMKIE